MDFGKKKGKTGTREEFSIFILRQGMSNFYS